MVHDLKKWKGREKHTFTVWGQKCAYKRMGREFYLVECFGTAPKQNLTETHVLRYHAQIWNTACLHFISFSEYTYFVYK